MVKNMNTIWHILEIEPTTDKRIIKKAYAARTKSVHPEEKPEEFRILHEAYQQALAYAGDGSGQTVMFGKNPGSSSPDRRRSGTAAATKDHHDTPYKTKAKQTGADAADSDTGQAKQASDGEDLAGLYSYFSLELAEKEQKLEQFRQRLEDICIRRDFLKAGERWKEYQNSEEFHSIQWQPQVLDLLIEKIKEELQDKEDLQEDLWNTYGFSKGADLREQDEARRLYEALLPAYERTESRLRIESEWMKKLEKRRLRKKILKKFLIAAAFIVCILAPVSFYYLMTGEQRYVSISMTRKYQAVTFSKPIKLKKPELKAKGIQAYSLHTGAHPDLSITAYVKKETVGSDRRPSFQMIDDYGIQLLKRYGEAYDLKWGYVVSNAAVWSKRNTCVVYYSEGEDLKRLCLQILKQLREHPELSFLKTVGILPEHIRYPEIMIKGGREYDFPKPQIYTVDQLTDWRRMKTDIGEGYIDYMYNYEAWNLSPEQQKAYGKDYAERGYEWERNRFSAAGQYNYIEGIPSGFGYDLYLPIHLNTGVDVSSQEYISSYWIFIGNAYQLLKAEGAALRINKDRSGFEVESGGKIYLYGGKTDLNLNEILKLIGKKRLEDEVETFDDIISAPLKPSKK